MRSEWPEKACLVHNSVMYHKRASTYNIQNSDTNCRVCCIKEDMKQRQKLIEQGQRSIEQEQGLIEQEQRSIEQGHGSIEQGQRSIESMKVSLIQQSKNCFTQNQ